MAATRRLQKELRDLKTSGLRTFRDIHMEEGNILHWHGLLLPDAAPYNKAAFKVEIIFPAEYPFKPPKITFKTKIYHPNVDEKGQVCLPIISAENWKPATKTDQVESQTPTLSRDSSPLALSISRSREESPLAEEPSRERATTVIQALADLVNEPEPEHPLRADIAEEFTKDRKRFFKNADDYTKKYGEKRPAD